MIALANLGVHGQLRTTLQAKTLWSQAPSNPHRHTACFPLSMKNLISVTESASSHWVGDGFPVRSMFSPQPARARFSPYILMDYAGPFTFSPGTDPRGVDEHPHRGFETVTVVYQGELEHRDSAGNSGRIGPGDVQWMTAASGVLHEEKHSAEFARRGGVLEMAQLWVNLPARHKMSPPRYQTLVRDAIPTVPLGDGAGSARVIAGPLAGVRGAAETFTPVILWDVRLRAGATVRLPVPEGFTVAALVRRGAISLGEGRRAKAMQLAAFERAGADIELTAEGETELLVLGGEPIEEPVAAYGPFVMNTFEEIQSAIRDFSSGRLGRQRV